MKVHFCEPSLFFKEDKRGMKYKKIKQTGLCIACVLALAGCGSNSNTVAESQITSEIVETETASVETATEPATEVAESVETIESAEAELTEEEITYINSDDYNTAEEVTEPVNEQPEQTVADYEVEPITGTMYATQSVNVRQEPTVDSSKVGSKSYAEAVEVTGKVTSYKGESCLWYQTSDGTYISGNYLTDTKPAVTTNKTNTGSTNNSNSTSTPSNNSNNNNSTSSSSSGAGGISQDAWDALAGLSGGQSSAGGQASLGDSSYGGGAHIN